MHLIFPVNQEITFTEKALRSVCGHVKHLESKGCIKAWHCLIDRVRGFAEGLFLGVISPFLMLGYTGKGLVSLVLWIFSSDKKKAGETIKANFKEVYIQFTRVFACTLVALIALAAPSWIYQKVEEGLDANRRETPPETPPSQRPLPSRKDPSLPPTPNGITTSIPYTPSSARSLPASFAHSPPPSSTPRSLTPPHQTPPLPRTETPPPTMPEWEKIGINRDHQKAVYHLNLLIDMFNTTYSSKDSRELESIYTCTKIRVGNHEAHLRGVNGQENHWQEGRRAVQKMLVQLLYLSEEPSTQNPPPVDFFEQDKTEYLAYGFEMMEGLFMLDCEALAGEHSLYTSTIDLFDRAATMVRYCMDKQTGPLINRGAQKKRLETLAFLKKAALEHFTSAEPIPNPSIANELKKGLSDDLIALSDLTSEMAADLLEAPTAPLEEMMEKLAQEKYKLEKRAQFILYIDPDCEIDEIRSRLFNLQNCIIEYHSFVQIFFRVQRIIEQCAHSKLAIRKTEEERVSHQTQNSHLSKAELDKAQAPFFQEIGKHNREINERQNEAAHILHEFQTRCSEIARREDDEDPLMQNVVERMQTGLRNRLHNHNHALMRQELPLGPEEDGHDVYEMCQEVLAKAKRLPQV